MGHHRRHQLPLSHGPVAGSAHHGVRPLAKGGADEALVVEGDAGCVREPGARHGGNDLDQGATAQAVAALDLS